MVQPPEQRCSGSYLDHAVDPKSDKRNRSREQSGDDRDKPFEAVISNCEILEPAPAFDLAFPVDLGILGHDIGLCLNTCINAIVRLRLILHSPAGGDQLLNLLQ